MSAPDDSKTLYTYDDVDRLVRIENRSAAGTPKRKSEFTYDFASRKVVSKEFTYSNSEWSKTSETRRVFDGLDVIQERNDQNEATASYVRDGNIGGILARTSQSGKSYFHYDGGGNVMALSDETGALVGRYSYDAFGNTLEASGPRAAENPYRFSTKEWHAASGMYDYGYRFYSPGMGRWLNRDPIRESGGINLYAMVRNNPINEWDEYGMIPVPPGVSIDNNIRQAEVTWDDFRTPYWFYSHVRNKGPWDYKQRGRQYQDFGNFNYGATGRAFGYSTDQLLQMAGRAQMRAGTSKPGWGRPRGWLNPLDKGVPPYGDDPRDQAMIKRGCDYYDHFLRGRQKGLIK